MKSIDLSGRRAVVTGGSDGIGLSIARALAAAGAAVLIVGRDAAKLEAARASLPGAGNAALAADLAAPGAVAALAEGVLAHWPELDILVNNAGIARFTPFADCDEELLDLHLDLNLNAPFHLTRRLFPALAARRGSVLNISSFFARRMLPGRPSTAYSATKGAIDAFTKALAFEAGPLGIRVNAIAPGTVDTPLVRTNLEALPPEGREKFHAMVETIYPLGRLGQPEDIADAALMLASDYGRWITGAILAVDGGLSTN